MNPGAEQLYRLPRERPHRVSARLVSGRHDLNDRNDTEYAAKEIINPVTRQMDMIRAAGGTTGFGNADPAQAQGYAAAAHADSFAPYAGAREMKRLQRIMSPIGQAPLPLEISNNPNYRSPV